ncbi:DevR family CRISPR-associated autoregulator [Sulfolobus tengchongensis]|uniref:DevR family CRISPR-associated autoregulator n=1 Tax=Sulfolobus tengchongensis TaxID=207809 RepID=A0AAX4L1T9_9CREN
MVFVSFGIRLRINIEAANMIESFGNYVRHRIAPVVMKTKDGYRIVFAPTISGQSIAHAYMRALTDLSLSRGLNLCDDCKNYKVIGGFLKRSGDPNTPSDDRVRTCVVDDVTGYMAAVENVSTVMKRTSRIMFSYMVPDVDVAEATVMPQFHVRFNQQQNENDIFQIESGSAIYMLGIGIDVNGIGLLSNNTHTDDYLERVATTFDALISLFSGGYVGAKKSRYLPLIDVLGGVSAISDPIPFSVSSPKYGEYVKDTLNRAKAYVEALNNSNSSSKTINEKIIVIYFDKEGIINSDICKDYPKSNNIECENAGNLDEMIKKTKDKALSWIKPSESTTSQK